MLTSLRYFVAPTLLTCISFTALGQDAPQGVLAANTTFVESWNRHDAAAVATSFEPDVLFVAPTVALTNRQGVQQYYERLFGNAHPSSDFGHAIDHVQKLSDDLEYAVGHWSLSRPALTGYWSAIFEQKNGTWVMRAHTYNIAPPPAK
jgi:uncharacterized protein (TIGR02246 family)